MIQMKKVRITINNILKIQFLISSNRSNNSKNKMRINKMHKFKQNLIKTFNNI